MAYPRINQDILIYKKQAFEITFSIVASLIRQFHRSGVSHGLDRGLPALPVDKFSVCVPNHNLPCWINLFFILCEWTCWLHICRLSCIPDCQYSYSRRNQNTPFCPLIFKTQDPLHTSLAEMAMAFTTTDGFKWQVNTLRVSFLKEETHHPLSTQRRKDLIIAVKTYAVAWEPFANIKFNFMDDEYTGYAEIRVQFYPGGSNTQVGTGGRTQAYDAEIGDTNMYLKSSMDPATLPHTIIHEFGHILGAGHEHQSPNAGAIQWNKRTINKHYLDERGWVPSTVNENIYEVLATSQYHASAFDPLSIMMYDIHPGWTKDGFVAKRGRFLSAMDKSWISREYPQPARSIGSFSADQHNTSKQFTRQFPSAKPPCIALGITEFNISNDFPSMDARVDYKEDSFVIALNSLSRLESASATWLETAIEDPSFKVDTFRCQGPNTQVIEFGEPFLEIPGVAEPPPTVVVWLHSFKPTGKDGLSIKVYPSNQTARGFTLHIETGAEDYVTGSWIAYPDGMPGTWAGYIETEPGDTSAEGTIRFPNGKFTGAPQVALAVNWIDFAAGKDVRFDVSTNTVTSVGMKWKMDSCIGASYLAHNSA